MHDNGWLAPCTELNVFCLHSNVGQFYSFVDAIAAPNGVGGDTAEDVFGGLEAVTKLAWREIGTKVPVNKNN